LVCLDIETVPDRTLIPDWEDGKFPPKLICHQVVAISFVEADIDRNETSLRVSRAAQRPIGVTPFL